MREGIAPIVHYYYQVSTLLFMPSIYSMAFSPIPNLGRKGRSLLSNEMKLRLTYSNFAGRVRLYLQAQRHR